MISGRTIETIAIDIQPFQKGILRAMSALLAPQSMSFYVANPKPVQGSGEREYDPLFVTKDAQKEDPAVRLGRNGLQKTGVAYVLYKLNETRSYPTRVLRTSTAQLEFRLGSAFWLADGKAGIRGNLGRYVIVGCIDYDNDEQVGTIPSRFMASCLL